MCSEIWAVAELSEYASEHVPQCDLNPGKIARRRRILGAACGCNLMG